MVRRLLATCAATLLLAGLALQSAGAQSPTPTEEKVTFVYGDTGEPSSINPFRGYLSIEFYFWAWSYHLPITFGVENLEAVPDFVTDTQVSEDGRTFTYTVRDDLTWSDGEPMTAQDMAFTLNLYKDKHAYLPQGYLQIVTSVEAPDDTHVILKTEEATSLYSGAIPYMYTYILPEHVWQEHADSPKAYDNVPMVGSGPFFVAEYERGQFVRLERNTYWEGPAPAMDEIIYRIFKNEDAEAEALKQGEIDFGYFDSANVYNSLKAEPNIATQAGSVPSFDEIAMNTGSAFQEPDPPFQPHGDGHPALQDPILRRAIRMAIDSQEIVDKVLFGYSEPGTTVVPPVSVAGSRWVPEGDDLIAFDLEAANQLLDEAGYRDTDGDGIREMPGGGVPLELRYYTQTNDQNTIKTAPFVESWLEDIGIRTEVTAMSSGRLGDEINAGTYDLFHWGWLPDPDPDSVLQNWTCGDRPPNAQTYGDNDAFYCNPQYDALYQESRTTLDPQRRLELLRELQRVFYNDAAYVVLYYLPLFQAYRTDTFTGYVPQPQPDGDLLTGYSRDSVLTIRPASEGAAASTTETRGIPAWVWIAIGVGVVVVIVVLLLVRRRGGAEDRA
jgi:peptide/nickel transport system substrate-binding protein